MLDLTCYLGEVKGVKEVILSLECSRALARHLKTGV